MGKVYLKMYAITSYSFSLSFLLVVEQLERRGIRAIISTLDQLQALSLVLFL
jgi:hypothetical protein